MRSTIVPGTMEEVCIPTMEAASGMQAGKDFGVGYFPEFLRESTAIEDYYDPGLIVFGSLDEKTQSVLTAINQDLPCEMHRVDIRTAEMVKYTSNSWRAMKISFANEIGNIAKANDLDGQTVMRILCSDHKVAMSPAFLRPGFAFGGSCLPKDVRALRHVGSPIERGDAASRRDPRGQRCADHPGRGHGPLRDDQVRSAWSASASSRAPMICGKARWQTLRRG